MRTSVVAVLVVCAAGCFGLIQACGHAATSAPATATATPATGGVVPGIPDSVFPIYGFVVSDPGLTSPPPISRDQAIAIVGGNSNDVQSATLVEVTGKAYQVRSGIYWILVFTPGRPMETSGPPHSPGPTQPSPLIKYSFVLVDAHTGARAIGVQESF